MSHVPIPEADFRAWADAVAARQAMRGAAAIAKEMESHLSKRDASGNVVVQRHTLFSWAEALDGIAHRDPRMSSAGSQLSLQQVASDVRTVLGGKPPEGASTAHASAAAEEPAPESPPQEAPRQTVAAPVTYTRGGASSGSGSGGARFVPHAEVGDTVRRLLREAKSEVLVVSPWPFGLDSLAEDLKALPQSVAIRLVTRRGDDAGYHRGMEALTKRGAEAAFPPYLQTRMLIIDGQRALIGAASIPPAGAPTREAAVLVTDADAVRAAREHFARVFQEK